MISPLFAPCSLADNYAVSVLVFHGEPLSFPLLFMACNLHAAGLSLCFIERIKKAISTI